MYEQLIHIRIFCEKEFYDVWISNTYVLDDFIEDIEGKLFTRKITYQHFIFHIENKCILDGTKSFAQNDVIQGDHLILF